MTTAAIIEQQERHAFIGCMEGLAALDMSTDTSSASWWGLGALRVPSCQDQVTSYRGSASAQWARKRI
ncbi:MAG: hypothetical protein EA401_00170 [Planctomycetota bacterium]|nr:MAG: hypothetical protein EA401_00170 [Planctomycetota bacterium]